jgi:protease IV
MRDSIFYSSIRAFFLTFFGVVGILCGIFVLLAMIGAFSVTSEGEPEITYKYTPEIQPNSQGVRKELSNDAPVILKIPIKGFIGSETFNHNTIQQQLVESRERSFKNDRVKALLLYIDSPGGSAMDADAIYRAIKNYKETYKVPVYTYVEGMCASGGMYIASASDKIYASNTSIIGSVGVIISSILNFSQLMEKVGVQAMTIYDGKGKDNLNPLRPWKEGEEDNIKEIVDYLYQRFVDIVVEARPNLDKEKLINEYGANVYPAETAKSFGFIDESNSSQGEVLKDLAEKIGIHDEYYQVVTLESKNWFSELFSAESGLMKGRITHQLELPPEMHPNFSGKYLYLYRQ